MAFFTQMELIMTPALLKKSTLTHPLETTERTLTLADFKGKKIVLYFYPKDNTSGCTQESKDFRDSIKEFEALNVVILGVSRDSLKSHAKFITDHDLPFTLISDPLESFCHLFDVMKEKSMYGKKYNGIERSTFVIDENGVLLKEWRNVKVPGHVSEILEFLKNQE